MRHIPPGHPIYGLQARLRREAPAETLEDLASEYLCLVREIQPVGPYHLLGWSFGGLVAQAMASALQKAGQEVRLLALLDSYPSHAALSHAVVHEPDEREFCLGLIGPFEYDLAALGNDPLGNTLEILRRASPLDSGFDESRLSELRDVFRNNWRLAHSFVPQRFNGDMLFFSAEKAHLGSPTRDWAPHVNGAIKVHRIECAHDQMMAPAPLAQIGKIIAEELRLRRTR
jgi:nonribosomal peptide synthetase DhbF